MKLLIKLMKKQLDLNYCLVARLSVEGYTPVSSGESTCNVKVTRRFKPGHFNALIF